MSKKILMAVLFLCMGIALANAQHNKKKADIERFKAEKKAFLIKETEMTEQEAAEFFPIYDKMQDEKFQLNRSVRKQIKAAARSEKEVSDEEYIRIVEAVDDLPAREAEIGKRYTEQFRRILSPEKMFRYKMAEIKFTHELLKGHRIDKVPEEKENR